MKDFSPSLDTFFTSVDLSERASVEGKRDNIKRKLRWRAADPISES